MCLAHRAHREGRGQTGSPGEQGSTGKAGVPGSHGLPGHPGTPGRPGELEQSVLPGIPSSQGFPTQPQAPPIQSSTISDSCDREEPCTNGDQLPDPADCTKYYQCNPSRVWHTRHCDLGKKYDKNTHQCVKSQDATCEEPCPEDSTQEPVEIKSDNTGEGKYIYLNTMQGL